MQRYCRLHRRLRCGLALVAALGLTSPPAAADPVTIAYRLFLHEAAFGSATLTAESDGARYTLTVIARFGDTGVQGWAAGQVGRGGLAPSVFTAEIVRGEKKRRIGFGFKQGTADRPVIDPPLPPGDAPPPLLADRHLRGVIDPVSALVLPAAPLGYAQLSACGRTQRVFDGLNRFDVVLFPSRSETIVVNREPLLTFACRMRWTPAADRAFFGIREMRGLVWFAPVLDGTLLVPVRAELDTPRGKVLLEAYDLAPFRILRPASWQRHRLSLNNPHATVEVP